MIERKRYHSINNEFFHNQNKTAWLKFNGQIRNEKDFWAVSPFSTKGSKKSNVIWKDEIGDRERNYGQQKTYNGNKNYIYQRIAYNMSQEAKNLPTIWHQYDDFSSHDEAFNRADEWFHGNDKLNLNNNNANRQRSRLNKNRIGSQLNPQFNYNQSDQNHDRDEIQVDNSDNKEFGGIVINDIQDHNNRAFNEFQSDNISKNMKVETNLDDGSTYISYPDSPIYWKCPNLNSIRYFDIQKKIREYRSKQKDQKLDHLLNKKIYCGSDLNDYLRLKICYSHRFPATSNQDHNEEKSESELDSINLERDRMKQIIEELEKEFPELKNLENFGNPGQCFNYGKIYNEQLKHSYEFFTR
jgi:hypothetical protein